MNPTQDDTQPKRRRRRGSRWALWLSGVVVVLLLLGVGGLYSLLGKPLVAPPWLHSRLEERLSALLPQAQVRFETISVVISQESRPRVSLRGVDIVDKGGVVLVALNELEAGLAARPLLEGKLQLGRVRLSGGEVFVRRRKDGSFNLSFGARAPEGAAALSPAELIGQMDALFQTDELGDLSEIRAEALILRYEDLRANRAWTVDGGRVLLTRNDEELRLRGDLALLGGHDYVTTVELNFDSRIGETSARFGMGFEDMAAQDIAAQSAAVAWLDAVRAPISGALRGAITAEGTIGSISGTLQIGEGVIQPTEETTPVPFQSARSYFTYTPENKTLVFDELSVASPWVSVRAEGKTVLKMAENGLPEAFQGQFKLADLSASPADLLSSPVTLDAAEMSFRLRLDPFELHMGELTLEKQGQVVSFQGRVSATDQGWSLAASGQTAELDTEVVLKLWPEDLKPKTRTWVVENIHSARLSNGQVAYRKTSGEPHDLYAGFEFREANVSFSRHLPPIEAGVGHAEIRDKRFVVTADHGYVTAPQGGRVDITGTTFVIPDVTVKPAPGEVNLKAAGTVTAALSLLDQEPLALLRKAGRPVDLADGRVRAQGQLRLPLKKALPAELVQFEVDAELMDLRSDKLVPGKSLAAPRLELTVDNERLVIAGRGRLGNVPFDAVYEDLLSKEHRGKSSVYGEVELSQAFLDEFNIALPSGSVGGRGQGRFVLALEKDAPPQFEISSDLAGLSLSVPQLAWRLAPGSKGTLEARGSLGQPPKVDHIALDAPGLQAEGSVSLTADGQLDQVVLGRVRAGNWLDVPVTLKGRGKGAPVGVVISGGVLDMRRKPDAGGVTSDGGQGSPMDVLLDRLQLTDSIQLTGLKGAFDTRRGLAGKFVARVNGKSAIAGTVTPVGDRSSFEIRSKDAGAVLSAAGFLQQGRKGDMVLTLVPVARDGHYDGYLKINNTRIVELPALAALLNAISVVGLLDQLSGPGLLFSDVEARFRLTPKQVILRSGSAVGASMGLSLDGAFDIENKQMDLQGVISPFYALNGVGSILTRKGEGLIGFNYRLTGSTEKPKVRINPLSLFTPGMFREIFRRPPPKIIE